MTKNTIKPKGAGFLRVLTEGNLLILTELRYLHHRLIIFMTIRALEDMRPNIAASTYVDETAVIIGSVEIGEHSSIWPQTVIRGDVNHIRIGNRTNIQDACVLHVTHQGHYNPSGYTLSIGNEVTVGHRAILHGCEIGDCCLIGMGTVIMDGAVLESDVLLGAGSLVPPGKRLETGFLWLGSPARKIRELSADELKLIRYSADQYVNLKERYLENQ